MTAVDEIQPHWRKLDDQHYEFEVRHTGVPTTVGRVCRQWDRIYGDHWYAYPYDSELCPDGRTPRTAAHERSRIKAVRSVVRQRMDPEPLGYTITDDML